MIRCFGGVTTCVDRDPGRITTFYLNSDIYEKFAEGDSSVLIHIQHAIFQMSKKIPTESRDLKEQIKNIVAFCTTKCYLTFVSNAPGLAPSASRIYFKGLAKAGPFVFRPSGSNYI